MNSNREGLAPLYFGSQSFETLTLSVFSSVARARSSLRSAMPLTDLVKAAIQAARRSSPCTQSRSTDPQRRIPKSESHVPERRSSVAGLQKKHLRNSVWFSAGGEP